MLHPKESEMNNKTAGLISSKMERINQIKKLIEEGKIFFNPISYEIHCDFGSGKDESKNHIFCKF